jgi:hypothetical protein
MVTAEALLPAAPAEDGIEKTKAKTMANNSGNLFFKSLNSPLPCICLLYQNILKIPRVFGNSVENLVYYS